MDLSSFYDFLYACLCMSLFYQPAHAQQVYLNSTQYCDDSRISKGYLCDSSVKSCQSFVTFRSQPPHDTAISIASLLASKASEIASVNKVSASDKIPSNRLVVVPVSCSCSGSISQHSSTYTVTKGDTYYKTAVYTFQGLATCQSMIGQNYYEPVNITVGAVLTVPMRCACPSEKQTADGITSLLTYIVAMNDTIARIGEIFGVNSQSILEANLLSRDSIIDPNTTVLVPLKSKKCPTSDGNFVANGSILDYVDCIRNGKKFPVKLVTLLGIGIGFAFICVFLLCYYLYQCHEGENLVASFISLTREDELVQILDPQVARDADVKQIRTIAELAKRCLRLNGAKRPSMKEVSTELEGLRNAQRCHETFREDPIEQNIDFPMEIESASL
ncbi:hypothetical protein C1H46_025714 [Malus baccata]|uniref:LysM domain-containing protein n=1 Tax=Malus baccata TaxID=106549 RepID=A0A540LQD6_MALBA|nr:hypothetical protein C1H46_025714 [Malus baccata]